MIAPGNKWQFTSMTYSLPCQFLPRASQCGSFSVIGGNASRRAQTDSDQSDSVDSCNTDRCLALVNFDSGSMPEDPQPGVPEPSSLSSNGEAHRRAPDSLHGVVGLNLAIPVCKENRVETGITAATVVGGTAGVHPAGFR